MHFNIFVFSKLGMTSKGNPIMNKTCPSSRNCPTHKINTGGLFSAFYNENSSIHCGQQNLKFPALMKMQGGSALPDDTNINLASGDYLLANNGPSFCDMYTNASWANGRNTMVNDMSLKSGGKVPRGPNGAPAFANVSPTAAPPKKEKWTSINDFTSKINTDYGMSSAGATNTYLGDNVLPCKSQETAAEKFCAACASPSGCVIIALIAAILVIVFFIWMSNKISQKACRKDIFGDELSGGTAIDNGYSVI